MADEERTIRIDDADLQREAERIERAANEIESEIRDAEAAARGRTPVRSRDPSDIRVGQDTGLAGAVSRAATTRSLAALGGVAGAAIAAVSAEQVLQIVREAIEGQTLSDIVERKVRGFLPGLLTETLPAILEIERTRNREVLLSLLEDERRRADLQAQLQGSPSFADSVQRLADRQFRAGAELRRLQDQAAELDLR